LAGTFTEIVGFQVRFDEAAAAANRIDLEGAAYLIGRRLLLKFVDGAETEQQRAGLEVGRPGRRQRRAGEGERRPGLRG